MKKIKYLAIAGMIILTLFQLKSSAVKKGTYHIRQAAVTGKVSAIMETGPYWQLFSDIQVWPKAKTLYFTGDVKGDIYNQPIEVWFNDGSMCKISGTLRIVLPVKEEEAVALTTRHGYESYKDLELKLLLTIVRNALRSSASLMSARDSYSSKRSAFVSQAWDQIQNGLYETAEVEKEVRDTVSGEIVTRNFKIIKSDKDGKPIYQRNPLRGLGLGLLGFEIKSFEYEEKIRQEIIREQNVLIKAETASTCA